MEITTRCGELEFVEDVCNQCPLDTHTEEEAIKSGGPKVTPTTQFSLKFFFKPYFVQ